MCEIGLERRLVKGKTIVVNGFPEESEPAQDRHRGKRRDPGPESELQDSITKLVVDLRRSWKACSR
jgi:hypothetical protein